MVEVARVWELIDATGDCWEWTGHRVDGYGRVRAGGRNVCAHRLVYEVLVGPVPDGLQLDHLCRNRACVNPDHLEPVTRRENILRGYSFSAAHARKTHCPKGHPYDGTNLHVRPDGDRRCRACVKAANDARPHLHCRFCAKAFLFLPRHEKTAHANEYANDRLSGLTEEKP